jgi:hypothetical protein
LILPFNSYWLAMPPFVIKKHLLSVSHCLLLLLLPSMPTCRSCWTTLQLQQQGRQRLQQPTVRPGAAATTAALMVTLMRRMHLSMQQQQASQLHSVLAALPPQHAATAAAEPVVR